ncbi:M48 family metallopeptidase [bacterium]|nr:M48 family metallopeptidase [bacterium]
MRPRHAPALLALLLALACSTSPLGRKQLTLVPDTQMNAMGLSAFEQMKTEVPVEKDPAINAYVRCVAEAVLAVTADQTGVSDWEVVVFKDDTANAFALPGGRIGVHTGLLKVAKTPDQLAAVIGHEIAHVIARHGNERVSQGMVAELGLGVIDVMVGDPQSKEHQQMMGLLGLGTQVGILLPFSRGHESEADLMGLDALAQAGFDPRAAVELWRNMDAAGSGQPPEFLSTHPSHATRIGDLEARLASAQALQAQARAAGRKPNCKAPAGR